MADKALSLLGLARRAGKVTWHEDANLTAIRAGQARLLILAKDAGDAVAKKYRDKSLYYEVPVIVFADKEELGNALGTSPRSAAAILDEGFAERLKGLIAIN